MATYYSSWSNVKNPCISIRLKVVVSSKQNVASNTSSITVSEYIERKNYYAYGQAGDVSGITSKHKLKINGTTYTSSGEREWNSNGATLIQSKSLTINHNIYGEASFTFSASAAASILTDYGYGIDTSVSIGTKTITLPKINRSSSITSNATSNTKFGDAVSFTISRYNSNFTHTISYKMYDAGGTIATGVGTSKSWTIPTSLIESTPDNANPTIAITCTTYSGSTKIGSSTYSFKCNVPDTYQPTCSLSLEDIGLVPPEWDLWVKGKSIARGTITASGSGGSTIKSYISRANDEVYTINPFITNYLKNEGERTATTTVTDSRGRTATASQTIQVVDYFPPTISMCKVVRCNSSGVLDDNGEYGKATIQYKISPVDNHNSKTIKVVYGDVEKTAALTDYEGTYTFNELFSGLETNASYNFEFSIIDTFETVLQTYLLPPSFVTISKLAGGRGVTFGQVATEEGLISHMNTKLYKNNWLKNVSVDGLKTEKFQGGWITYAEDET